MLGCPWDERGIPVPQPVCVGWVRRYRPPPNTAIFFLPEWLFEGLLSRLAGLAVSFSLASWASFSCAVFLITTPLQLLMDTDIMTIKEVSDYLKLTEKTAYRLAAEGKIPGFKVGGAWRFKRGDINAWITKQLEQQQRRNKGDN